MKLKFWLLFIVCLCIVGTSAADTLRLTNGQVIYGQFVGRTAQGVQFILQNGNPQTFPSDQVASLTFGPIPASQQPPPQPPQMVTLLAGTEILVRTTDTLDTQYTQTGQIFSATLATNLLATGTLGAHIGTPVYGTVVLSQSAGRATGTSKLQLQLTQLVIGGNPVPIVTNTVDTQGKSSGKRSAFRLFGGAGLGAAIGAIAGNAGMGAAIGAVAGGIGSVVQKGNQVQIPAETLLQFVLQQPVTIPAAQ